MIAQYKPSLFWNWADYIFEEQSKWFNKPTENKTPNEIINEIGLQIVVKRLGIPIETFISGMENQDIDTMARTSWKWASSRNVFTTPMNIINGILMPALNYTWTFDQWTQYLDPYFSKK